MEGLIKTTIIPGQDRQSSSQSLNLGLSECEAGVLINDDMKLDGTRRSYQKVCSKTREETRVG
jgi:hypothetical protein